MRGANGDGFSALNGEVTDRQASAPADIQEHELVIRLSGHAAGVFRLRGREGNDLERRLFFSLRQFEVFDLRVPILEAIEVEQQEILILDLLADGNMILGGR